MGRRRGGGGGEEMQEGSIPYGLHLSQLRTRPTEGRGAGSEPGLRCCAARRCHVYGTSLHPRVGGGDRFLHVTPYLSGENMTPDWRAEPRARKCIRSGRLYEVNVTFVLVCVNVYDHVTMYCTALTPISAFNRGIWQGDYKVTQRSSYTYIIREV